MVNVINNKVYKVKCLHCKSKLQYKFKEIEFGHKRDYTGSVSAYSIIKCPVCKAIVNV